MMKVPGVEKSSISLLKIIPVRLPITFDPRPELIVEVIETAIPSSSTIFMWAVPESSTN
jgi:hypothetical protein